MSLISPLPIHVNHAQTIQALPPDYSDDSLALWFAQSHAHDLRYLAPRHRWLQYDGKVWREDDTLKVRDEVRRTCRTAAAAYGDPKIAGAGKVAAVERLAKSDRRLAAAVDQWDANMWLLNTPTGAVDLQTGKLRNHLPDDYCTKSIDAIDRNVRSCSAWIGKSPVASTSSNVPWRRRRLAAPFGPTPRAPGSLSEGSPRRGGASKLWRHSTMKRKLGTIWY